MNFRSLAMSNIRGNWRAYSAFFLSSVFSVLIFYIYASFLYHPDVLSGVIVGANKVRKALELCEYVIVIFSFLFVLYATSAFLKTRKLEFGLLSLFGMTRLQLRKLVIYETIGIGMLAIGTGIAAGMLLSKLFFMAIGVLLGSSSSIAFAAPLPAIGLTAGGFLAMFLVIAIVTSLSTGRSEIIELIRASRKPRSAPKYSPWLSLLAAVCLGGGYYLAVDISSVTFNVYALPILALVCVGTYFLYTQASIFIVRGLQRRKAIYYDRTNMLTLSQLAYKMKDNARILFIVTLLSAVILTASGAVYIMQVNSKENAVRISPYTIAFTEKGEGVHEVIQPEKLEEFLKAEELDIKHQLKLIGIPAGRASIDTNVGNIEYPSRQLLFVSESDYNVMADQQSISTTNLQPQQAALVISQWDKQDYSDAKLEVTVGGEVMSLPITSTLNREVMNKIDYAYGLIVLDDTRYEDWLAKTPESERIIVYGYELVSWEKAVDAMAKLKQQLPEELRMQYSVQRSIDYADAKQTIALTLFIGLFISLLFFVASGSMIYFKLFTELQEDIAQFKALQRIGMTGREIRRIVTSQIAVVFYLPVLLGSVHALFAMQTLDNLMGSSYWAYAFVIIGIYAFMQTVYFVLASSSYRRKISGGSRG
ncbi:FtsX-like permease family protein [Paenibacillus sp. GCM10023252]|uniref:FtsX-like permease family protein n=1 Tax=Paenibacillus sp. GCM10023252 TaxID=3252649 RepID=UPI00361B8C7B